jgi:peptidoglycan/xylan/chitin deacetylase (PgdA/CDA1 family)
MKNLLQKLFYTVCISVDRYHRDDDARILMYHSFRQPAFFNVKEELFYQQLQYLQEKQYNFCSLASLCDRLEKGQNIQKYIVLTFDDGHKDFLDVVLPEIARRHIPVTLFWPTGVKDSILPTTTGELCPILNSTDILALVHGEEVEIGSHSVTHKELPSLSSEAAREEIVASYETIHALTNQEVAFAYPRGKYTSTTVSLVQEAGYYCACTVVPGTVSKQSDRYQLPRISIDSSVDMLAFKAKLTWLYRLYAIVRS